MMISQQFLHARSCYYGQHTPDLLLFNANLQEFAQRVTYIANLQTNGKLTAEESYTSIKLLWQELAQATEQLKIHERKPTSLL